MNAVLNAVSGNAIDLLALVLTNASLSSSLLLPVGFTVTNAPDCNVHLRPEAVLSSEKTRLLLVAGADVDVDSRAFRLQLLASVVLELRANAGLPPFTSIEMVSSSLPLNFGLEGPIYVNMVEIQDKKSIVLGCSKDAINANLVKELDIACIVNCSSSTQEKPFEMIEYFDLSVSRENPEAGTFKAFDQAIEFIENMFEKHDRILVHSTYGRSRCCILTVYLLMKRLKLPLIDAYHRVLLARPGMMPREAILDILLQKERLVYGTSVFDQEEDAKAKLKQLTKGLLLDEHDVMRHKAALERLNAAEIQILAAKQQQKKIENQPPSSFATNDFVLKSTDKNNDQKRRIVPETSVSCRWLFNRLQSGTGMLLIDARKRSAYEEDSIPTAILIPPQDTDRLSQIEKSILPEQMHLFNAKKRKLREVVIYGDTIKVLGNGTTKPWMRILGELLVQEGQVSSVRYLEDGFTTFQFRYPFYTTQFLFAGQSAEDGIYLARTQSGTHNINYPNEILDGFLFLGNMWHAQSSSVIRNLGITHIVNASLDTGNVFENAGVFYHEVKIKDDIYANIAAHFEPTFSFIEKAKQTQHSRVLIHCTQGISRSATLAIYYLMRGQRWSLVTAVNYCISNRGVCFPNQGFLQALMVEERELYHANTVMTHELDQLLEGSLPDKPVPKPMLILEPQSDECCHMCSKSFSFFEWRHRCGLCKRVVCSKCSTCRLILNEQADSKADVGRVCDHCIEHVWNIHLPLPFRLNVRMLFVDRYGPRQRKTILLKSPSLQQQVLRITYIPGTETQVLLDVLRKRLKVRRNELLDVTGDGLSLGAEWSLQNTGYLDLPDQSVIFASVGESGCIPQPSRNYRRMNPEHSYSGQTATFPIPTRRSRSFSEGQVPRDDHRPIPTPRQRDLLECGNNLATPNVIVDDTRFATLWNQVFPLFPDMPQEALLELDPELLTQVVLGLSHLNARLKPVDVEKLDSTARNALLDTIPLTTQARAFLQRYFA
ncbi:dual specificity phosphatase [Thraustotheca clavata]|uniref:Dual specificity phosphatase n=1 Tax=Thraustotheca clavata TaxID=74557 RepID=A0A1V9ZZ86_9STRA|nr:dual specificity phosphatase [Thraustotheca clavata]